jgi:hypothetical protein
VYPEPTGLVVDLVQMNLVTLKGGIRNQPRGAVVLDESAVDVWIAFILAVAHWHSCIIR